MPSFCGYVRVSDDKLKDDGSRRQDIERQKNLLKPYLDNFQDSHPDWKFVGWFEDNGKSAWTEDLSKRPEFNRLMGEVRANRLQWIFVEDLTRFARIQGWGLIWLAELGTNNCNLTSVQSGQHEVTSLAGFTKSSVLLMLAQIDSMGKSEKVVSGMAERKNNPNATCGSCNIVHMGRHPQTCECTVTKACRERRNFKSVLEKNEERVGRFVEQNLKENNKTS